MKRYFLPLQKSLACLLVLLVASCTTSHGPSGTPFSMKKTYLVVKGMAGEEVLQIMGSAPHERLVLDGRETWIWVFADEGITKSFSVSLFDKKVEDTFTYAE